MINIVVEGSSEEKLDKSAVEIMRNAQPQLHK